MTIPIISKPNSSTTIVYIPMNISSPDTISNCKNLEFLFSIDSTFINRIIPVNKIQLPTINLIACSTIFEKNMNIIANIKDTIPNIKFPFLGVVFIFLN